MRFILLLCIFLVTAMVGCKKINSCNFQDSNRTAPQAEQTALADSLQKYNITHANLHPSGFYYEIISPGTGGTVSNLCSSITATYWGGFFNGSGFDSSSTAVTFTLGQTIIGWQKAIPLLKGGGEMNIYIPPTLGYGGNNVTDQNGRVIIPANSYLVFKVKAVSIQ